ncbi:hypothetical protein DMN91_000623 [Ooceraea biroi]|uniref:Coiled-coil-helix-coiled-coil-helix domain-containing protein 7 n=1 Tax=Ooceraea biroi TaxID=2015173 RepID=A0A3L8E2G1_OOCBI|nr:coiled-coil-helix-coiled-coil-helix domain-containing protein 7 [Ooceraea biroi]XP_011343297.1 coiled-coil-helix-coiled-coil-helix domain-containing protein 7 [Ooceraea biroi]RLU26826.1 hypothetical protein DMN91_000623 [Ooceraea biroi]
MSTQRTADNVAEKVVKNSSLRIKQEEMNPCYKEHLLSLKCLNSNQGQHKLCEVYFINYKNCKKFWSNVQSERRLKGIKPYLPPLEERAKIKADYLSNK